MDSIHGLPPFKNEGCSMNRNHYYMNTWSNKYMIINQLLNGCKKSLSSKHKELSH